MSKVLVYKLVKNASINIVFTSIFHFFIFLHTQWIGCPNLSLAFCRCTLTCRSSSGFFSLQQSSQITNHCSTRNTCTYRRTRTACGERVASIPTFFVNFVFSLFFQVSIRKRRLSHLDGATFSSAVHAKFTSLGHYESFALFGRHCSALHHRCRWRRKRLVGN